MDGVARTGIFVLAILSGGHILSDYAHGPMVDRDLGIPGIRRSVGTFQFQSMFSVTSDSGDRVLSIPGNRLASALE
ncbi:hypothetical protein [Sphaerisporangium sp. NPDC051011]|uniref:hypothetical protein n=1 Tax=Sphaerisporangium sp. NPDC051011 TaxID=3155792 RepID=UPI003411D0B3